MYSLFIRSEFYFLFCNSFSWFSTVTFNGGSAFSLVWMSLRFCKYTLSIYISYVRAENKLMSYCEFWWMRRRGTVLWPALTFPTEFCSSFGCSCLSCRLISTAAFEFAMRTVWLFPIICLCVVFSVSQFRHWSLSLPTSICVGRVRRFIEELKSAVWFTIIFMLVSYFPKGYPKSVYSPIIIISVCVSVT